ncbi:hypothetical protein PAXINDRAFT_20643 [Paxillus involutus ATCC 200175]|uniref:Uncharacterized protein n=1 Tax=Paxillus involutus ATCC 200175 TaxID=664439 RepID=A0A0C9T427_PAXIN|nr:hypothetical protein PAXINDRAFT_20643 [Paxillus involutus ATCC 200175]
MDARGATKPISQTTTKTLSTRRIGVPTKSLIQKTSRASRPGEPVSTGNPLSSPPQTQGSGVIQHHHQVASSALASRSLQSQNLGSTKPADANIDFCHSFGIHHSPSLRGNKHPMTETEIDFEGYSGKRYWAPSSRDLLPAAVPPERRLALPASSSVDIVNIGANDEQDTPTESTEHVHKLYLVLTQGRDEDRPRFVRRTCGSAEPGETSVAGSKRRPEIAHCEGKGKRTRFKVTTAERYAGHSTEG